MKTSEHVDFYARKLVYVVLQTSIALAFAVAWLYVRICSRSGQRPPKVRSIAAVWYWPPDYPAASKTRLGAWKERFENEGVTFENFHIGDMAELAREYEGLSWTARYWFFTKLVWRRLWQLLRLRGYDVVWIDRWFLPHYPMRHAYFERCVRRLAPYLVIDSSDGSDYVGNPSLVLEAMTLADKITVAYKGLQEFYAPRFARVERFEYPILEEGYRIRTDHSAPGMITLGWMGSPSAFRYLKDIEGELRKVAARRPFRLLVICRQRLEVNVPGAHVSYHAYGPDYFDLLARFDIGLAPYTEENFSTTGKIGMKHQEFLLCAIPQVCSPHGISEYAVNGEHVLIARRVEDWSPAILGLMEDERQRSRLGRQGRDLCLAHYTVAGQWPTVKRILTSF